MSLHITLQPSRYRLLNDEEIKEHVESLPTHQLIDEYIMQTSQEDALKEFRQALIDIILDYSIHTELYRDKYVVRK